MNNKVQSKLMSIETLESLQELARKVDMLWFGAEYGSERRKAFTEVSKVIAAHIVDGLGRDYQP